MPTDPLTTKDGRDSLHAADLLVWVDNRGNYWDEIDGWRSEPLLATVYAPEYPYGRHRAPTDPPHRGFTGKYVKLADAVRTFLQRSHEADYEAARGGR